jgi:hypothetical protein
MTLGTTAQLGLAQLGLLSLGVPMVFDVPPPIAPLATFVIDLRISGTLTLSMPPQGVFVRDQ